MALLLSSTGLFSEQTRQEVMRLVPSITEKQVAIVTTASPQKEHNRFAQQAKTAFLTLGVPEEHLSFFDFDTQQVQQLASKDILYLNGGNPYYLLKAMKQQKTKKVFQQLLDKQKLIIGVSAGALVLGPDIELINRFTPEMNQDFLTDLRGLELTNRYIFPHYDRADLFGNDIEEKIDRFEQERNIYVHRLDDLDYLIHK
ncbi:Type 1 glutamine amidotransferase-like domain-containing protein [Enterococcus olivae]